MFGNLVAWVRKYRWPITLGAGGVVAYGAFNRSRQAAVAQVAAAQAAAPAPAALSPDEISTLIGQGARISSAAQAPLVGLAQGGLDTASVAAQGAQALAAVAVGNLGEAASTLGSVVGQVTGLLPSFAPAAGIAPQPTQPQPQPAPSPAPAPAPAPAPTPTAAAKTITGYRVSVRGTLTLYTYQGGVFVPHPQTFQASGSSAPVTQANWGGKTAWVTAAGALKGQGYVSGLTGGDWRIFATYSDGSSAQVA